MNIDNINNASIVFRLDYENSAFLFTGDAEIQGERILANLGTLLHADVMKVEHHDSSTSSIMNLVKHVSPSYAVISEGENNRYGLIHRIKLCRGGWIPALRYSEQMRVGSSSLILVSMG